MAILTTGCESNASVSNYFIIENPVPADIGLTGGSRRWSFQSGSTSSSNTGPTIYHTVEGFTDQYYIYTESSSPTLNNDIFYLTAKVLPDDFYTNVQFSLNMFGPEIGNTTLEVKLWNSTTWDELYNYQDYRITDVNNIPSIWTRINADLPSECEQFRIKCRVSSFGTVYYNDIAIDAIRMTTTSRPLVTHNGNCRDLVGNIEAFKELFIFFKADNSTAIEFYDSITTAANGSFSFTTNYLTNHGKFFVVDARMFEDNDYVFGCHQFISEPN